MSELISVSLPGPWWTKLTYLHTETLAIGVRVSVPLGKSKRIGIVVEKDDDTFSNFSQLKFIEKVIDEKPQIPDDLLKTIDWFRKIWFVSFGMAAKIFLPTKFFSDEPLSTPIFPNKDIVSHKFNVEYLYEVNDSKRMELYKNLLETSSGSVLILFPEASKAKEFWNSLDEACKSRGLLWPTTQSEKQWKVWKEIRVSSPKFIVGSQTASFAPLNDISLIILDEECSRAWYTLKKPVFHFRPIISMRAKFASAKLVLGGRIPSSKAFIHCREQYKNSTIKKDNSKLVFVDLHNSSFFDVDAVKNCIPISKPLINRTKDTIALGKWALWILDRKGYAGEIYCEDCGSAIKCPCCGGTMRWKSKKNLLSCIVCGKTQPIPSSCPSCGGPFLEGVRPGLEALAMEAKKRFVNITKSVILFENDGEKVPSPDILIKENPNGALLIGTRKLLALTDKLDVDLIGWVDADGEARIAEYDAKLRAFCLIFESLWRGLSPESRTVLIQSRAPSKNWQASLGLGWNSFWKHEIEEREKWELPPFFPMIKVTIPKYCVNKFVEDLDKQFFDFWQSEENDCELWIRTKKFEKLYSLFSSYFEIKNVKRGFPDITLFLD